MNKYCNGVIHTVRKGDSLYSLSRQYDVPLVSILRANPYVDIYNLMIGSRICIPTGACGENRPMRPEVRPEIRPEMRPEPRMDMERAIVSERYPETLREVPSMEIPQAILPPEVPQEILPPEVPQEMRPEPRAMYPEEETTQRRWLDDIDLPESRMMKEDIDGDRDNDRRIAYVVREGESMKDILDKFGEDADDFLENNKLSDILLKPGITVFVEEDR